jgi:hypothetical protein
LWYFVHISKTSVISPACANFRNLRHANRCEVAGSESVSLVYGFDSTWPALRREALEEAASPRSPARPRGSQQPQGGGLQSPSGGDHGPRVPGDTRGGGAGWRTSFGTPLEEGEASPPRSLSPGRSPGRSPRRSARSGSPQASSRSGSPLASSRGRTPRHPRPRSPGRKTPRSPGASQYASEYGTTSWPPSDPAKSLHKPVLFSTPSRSATPRLTERSVYEAASRSLSGSPLRERSSVFDASPQTSRTAHEMLHEDNPRPVTMAGEHHKTRQLFEIQHLLQGRSSEDLEAITRLLKR